MTRPAPAFYARTGSPIGDLITILHPPCTLWHLSYVAIGAALAPSVGWLVLLGTTLAFSFGLGVGAHALDELHDRPLSTGLSNGWLRVLGWGGLAVGGLIAVAAAIVISPMALLWGAAGILLAAGYALEWSPLVHSTVGFGLAWGAFPVLVGYWGQTEGVSPAALAVAAAAAAFSMTQRMLSTPARYVRRETDATVAVIGGSNWERTELLATWERPLRLLVAAHVLLALGLLFSHLVTPAS
ncbi:MAG TPA: hypothetical protein VE569_06685 [Acidimicrobiia bacterium]|nr:hypothetical protein [Acidimicrobiia bacterium]